MISQCVESHFKFKIKKKKIFKIFFKIEKRKISKWIQTIKIYFQHLKCTWLFLSPI